MTTTKTIGMARNMLSAGNGGAYARLMSGAIRSSMSARTSNQIKKAISEDKAELLFIGLDTGCPTAA